jgi:plasmid stabilization system protein ParE
VTRLFISDQAAKDIDRLCDFLIGTMPEEAARTGDLIFGAIEILTSHPSIGRPLGEGLRELVISRGKSGYLALYLHDEAEDVISVMALRHQRESGYFVN